MWAGVASMRNTNYPSKTDNYATLLGHLLNSESPLNYSLEYLLENYGDRAVPALLQALPKRPWYEQQIILEALAKLGDTRAIVPVCALIYETKDQLKLAESVVVKTLRSLVYYCDDRKEAVDVLIDIMVRYKQCEQPIAAVLKEQKNKYTVKMAYKKLFRKDSVTLKGAAIAIVAEEDDLTKYRIKYLKKMLSRLSDPLLRDQAIDALKVLISRKRCKAMCQKKGLKFDAFFRRPDNESFDCCCTDKYNKRVLIKFEGALMAEKSKKQ